MPRPKKWRKVCRLPNCSEFRPVRPGMDSERAIILSVDEYETIRLIDHENFTQAQCVEFMDVARTTVQDVYGSARRKIAAALVNAAPLRIEGGSYQICGGQEESCLCNGCEKRRQKIFLNKGDRNTMKIAVTYENGEIFQHFGHTAQFKLYSIENNAIVSSEIVDTNGSGHGALGQFLADQGADTLICGGIGGGAQNALAEAGIRLYAGVSGNADAAVQNLLAGRLSYSEDATCSRHEHEHTGHTCGENGCGHSH